jgi:hypothetical protein
MILARTQFRLVVPLALALLAGCAQAKSHLPKANVPDTLPEFAGYTGDPFAKSTAGAASPTSATTTTAAMLENQTRGPDSAGQAAQNYDQAMIAKAVTARFSQIKLEDSMNLNRIAEAFANAAPDMVVHTLPSSAYARGDNGQLAVVFSPSVASDAQERNCHVDDPEEHAKLKSYGLALSVHTQGSPPFRTPIPDPVVTCASSPAQIGADAPALIWSVVQQGTWDYSKSQWKFSRVVFVTADGGRYVASVGALGQGPAGKVSANVQDPTLYPADVEALTRAGLLAARFESQMRTSKHQWSDCTNKVWATYKPQIDVITASQDLETDERERQVHDIAEKFDQAAMKRCKPALSKFEAALVGAIEQRNADRGTLYNRVRGVPQASTGRAPRRR